MKLFLALKRFCFPIVRADQKDRGRYDTAPSMGVCDAALS
jgi:hypothetical protein